MRGAHHSLCDMKNSVIATLHQIHVPRPPKTLRCSILLIPSAPVSRPPAGMPISAHRSPGVRRAPIFEGRQKSEVSAGER